MLSVLLLTACGNDNDDLNTTVNPDQLPTTPFQQWTTFYSYINEDDTLDIDSTQITIANGKYYSKPLVPADDQFPIYVTQNGFYDTGPEHESYGYLQSNIEIIGNTWKRELYSSIGSQGLTWTQGFKHIDLNGKSLAEIVMPYQNLRLQYKPEEMTEFGRRHIEKLQNLKFPQGATCLDWRSEEVSEDHIEISAYEAEYESEYQQHWNTLANQINPVVEQYTFQNIITYFEPKFHYGYAQYLGRYHAAYFYPQGLDDFDNDYDEIRQSIIEDNSLTETERKFQLELWNPDSDSCNLYNPIAIKAIQAAFK